MHVRCAFFAPRFSIAFVVFVVSCQDPTPVEVRVASSSSAAPSPAASPTLPRRPTLRHFLARTDERCEAYSMDGEHVSPAERVACPEDLEVGERIRVAGKTCVREGKRDRVRPVVCPGPLLLREKRDAGPDATTL